jgi:hypothetical protein
MTTDNNTLEAKAENATTDSKDSREKLREQLQKSVLSLIKSEQPEILQYVEGGGFLMYGITYAMDHANKQVRRKILDLYLDYSKAEGRKLYSESEILTRYSHKDLNLDDLNIDGDKLYEEAMNDKKYLEASCVAGNFKLPYRKENAARKLHGLRLYEKALSSGKNDLAKALAGCYGINWFERRKVKKKLDSNSKK